MAIAELVTDDNYSEERYLALNTDVAEAVSAGAFASGRQHYELFGRDEKRSQELPGDQRADINNAKARKLQRIEPLLRDDLPTRDRENTSIS